MSTRVVVCVATTAAYRRGMERLRSAGQFVGRAEFALLGQEPARSPKHSEVPYAFKAYALKHAQEAGGDTLLWCDACMLPVQDMTPLWERIERDGYWFSKCGWTNYEWTADSAYPDLFQIEALHAPKLSGWMEYAREVNRKIPHVVATCFGLSMRHEIGRKFLAEYYRLASETKAFCGPWQNANYLGDGWLYAENPPRLMPCGPSDVRGHRHDQTAASVIAWRLGMKLTNPPEIFAYGKAGEPHDPRTIMIADGSY